MQFVSDLLRTLLLLLILGSPLFYVARKQKRSRVAVRFAIIALVLAVFVAGIEATSNMLVERCEAAGTIGCVDYGASGGKVLIVGGYAVASWIRARNLWRPF